MTPQQMRELNRLMYLERLSLPMSMKDCVMNMPEVVVVLSGMSCLRYLVLSWGKWCNAYDIGDNRVYIDIQNLFEVKKNVVFCLFCRLPT